jgi:hypothetical protein
MANTQTMKPGAQNRRGDEWYTPPWLIRELGGKFDTDPCCPRRNHWTAHQCWTIRDNGLVKPWDGVVFCNPPYSNPLPWAERLREHPYGGIMLVPVRQSYWFQQSALASCTAWALLETRIAFCDINGERIGKGYSADVFCLICWGDEAVNRVRRAFLRAIDMLPDEQPPPKNERLWGRLYFEETPDEMLRAVGFPMSDDPWPDLTPEQIEAEIEEGRRIHAEYEALIAKKSKGVTHHIYKAPQTKAAAAKARKGTRPKTATKEQRSTP